MAATHKETYIHRNTMKIHTQNKNNKKRRYTNRIIERKKKKNKNTLVKSRKKLKEIAQQFITISIVEIV